MDGVTLNHWAKLVNDFGFPVLAVFGLGYFTWFVWKWVTKEINPMLDQAGSSLSKLKKQVTALDNDLIRLNIKLKVVLQDRRKIEELKRIIDKMSTGQK